MPEIRNFEQNPITANSPEALSRPEATQATGEEIYKSNLRELQPIIKNLLANYDAVSFDHYDDVEFLDPNEKYSHQDLVITLEQGQQSLDIIIKNYDPIGTIPLDILVEISSVQPPNPKLFTDTANSKLNLATAPLDPEDQTDLIHILSDYAKKEESFIETKAQNKASSWLRNLFTSKQ